ncbi:MAG: hypothetical protein J5486_02215 [Bacteroidaceae bacterium]|nr:hypothetical protein [Bacteroidaceae bacterium]
MIGKGRERDCQWHFAEQGGDREVGPNDALVENFKQGPYASLIRESVQNSLDAILDKSEPVRMEFSFREIRKVDFQAFFNLKEHIKGCIDYYNNNEDAERIFGPMLESFPDAYSATIYAIRVSDFNTKGMEYDAETTDSPFYAFVRSAGVSAKADSRSGGSFGFGKAAYFNMSPYRTVLISTMTEQRNFYFEGVCSLCTHKYRGKKMVANGFYDNNNGKPIEGEFEIPAPFRRKETGTDITIVGFDPDEFDQAKREMVESALRNFWMAILRGMLVIDIKGLKGEVLEHLDEYNVGQKIMDYLPDDKDSTRKNSLYYKPLPYYRAVALADAEPRFRKFEKSLSTLGHVEFYVHKNREASDKILYMREQLMVVQALKNNSGYGFYGVVVCDDSRGNAMLKRLENPAHNEWNARNALPKKEDVERGKEALTELQKFVSESLEEMFNVRNQEVLTIQNLERYLYVPASMLDEEQDEVNEAPVGVPTGKTMEEENASPTTDIDKQTAEDNREAKTGLGAVRTITSGQVSLEKSGEKTVGIGKTKKKTKQKGGSNIPGKNPVKVDIDEDAEGAFMDIVPVKFRVIAQNRGGHMEHHIIIHSPQDIERGEIELLISGDEAVDVPSIVSTSMGKVDENYISDISLQEGRNTIVVRFADEMRHSVKLNAYEYQ